MASHKKSTIALIGAAGTMGSRLLHRLLSAGYGVSVYDPQHVALEVLSMNVKNLIVHDSALSASITSDVVILAVPYRVELAIAEDIRDVLGNKIIVSISNPLTPTLDDVITPHDESAAEHLASLMPHARVVKALNSLSSSAFDVETTNAPLFDTFVASDDTEAAEIVVQIIKDIGFRPWFVGGLILSRTLERMSALLIGISQRYNLQGALGWRIRHVQQHKRVDV